MTWQIALSFIVGLWTGLLITWRSGIGVRAERRRAARICDVLARELRIDAPGAATTIHAVESIARMIRSGGSP